MSARILLVEDEPTLQRILGSVLTHAGHVVEAVGSAEGALQLIRDEGQEFDLVLADKNLPAMNGVELLGELRALEAQDAAPRGFVMATGYPSRDSVRDVLHLGGDGYLVKPFRSLTEAVGQVGKVLEADLAARRVATRRVTAAQDCLTAGVPTTEVFFVDIEDDVMAKRVTEQIKAHGARLNQGNATAYVVDHVDKLPDDASKVGIWISSEPAFGDLVDSVWRGGVRWLDPMQLGSRP